MSVSGIVVPYISIFGMSQRVPAVLFPKRSGCRYYGGSGAYPSGHGICHAGQVCRLSTAFMQRRLLSVFTRI